MCISAVGDSIAQLILESKPRLDPKRNAVVASYGFFETIVEGHFWLTFLERVFGNTMTFRTSLMKMMADQCFFSPLEVSSFMVWTHRLENRKTPTLWEKLSTDLPPTLITSYMFWCPASLFNFYVVPFHLRALFTCVMCVVWDTFMSFASHNKLKESLRRGTVVSS